MERKIILTDKAPKAIGPYSQAMEAGGFVFVSGQIPVDPANGEMACPDVKKQTERVLLNLKAVVEAAGCGLGDVVKTTVFMTDLGQFQAMNEVYSGFFSANPPARATVQVSALPRGALVEIEAVAVKKG
ncbi:MAG: RidA family protein [bacterium]